jgi:hypothetical protein
MGRRVSLQRHHRLPRRKNDLAGVEFGHFLIRIKAEMLYG